MGKPKGLLQVLWEICWIDEMKINDYLLRVGKASQMDEEGNILPQHWCFVLFLCSLMANCTDFKEEKSAVEVLLHHIHQVTQQSKKLIVGAPKVSL